MTEDIKKIAFIFFLVALIYIIHSNNKKLQEVYNNLDSKMSELIMLNINIKDKLDDKSPDAMMTIYNNDVRSGKYNGINTGAIKKALDAELNSNIHIFGSLYNK